MSEVWLARHEQLSQPVVVKTLRPEVAERVTDAPRLMREAARLMGRVQAHEIVRVLDLGVDVVDPADGRAVPCLVEEYVDGLDLAELDTRRREALHRPLPLWAVAEIIAEAAHGLHAAHQAGVVHRDVKPANLFGDAAGRIKVGDFGIAVAPREQRRCAVAGTPLFMAPEQLAGDHPDRRADVFSLGATAFALRYGAPPWADSGAMARGEVPAHFPRATSPDEAYFQHVVAHAMAHRPDARPPTARHLEERMRPLANRTRSRVTCREVGPDRYALGAMQVVLEVGDVSTVEADAIVSSAYSDMTMNQGVGRALKARGGDEIEDEALRGGPRPLGECVETGAGRLAVKRVLHAVGAWNEVSCIARALLRALWIAERKNDHRLAMPAIGTGRGRVSLASCADTIGSALRTHVMLGGRISEVRIVLGDAEAKDTFADVLGGLWLGHAEAQDHDAIASPTAMTAFASDVETHSAEPKAAQLSASPNPKSGTVRTG